MGKSVHNEETKKLMEGILMLQSVDECYAFFEDLCTVNEDKNIEALIYNFVMECMPSGWSNGASSECNKVNLKSGESIDIKMAYALNVPENADISKEEFHLVYRTYPQKIMFVLNI